MGYNIKKNSKNYVKERSTTERMLLLAPIFFVLAVVPLLMRYVSYDTKLADFAFFDQGSYNDDYMLYWKQWAFVAASTVSLIIIIVRACKDKNTLKFSKFYIPLAVYTLLALLSTIFSEYRSFGFSGIMDQFENVWCLLGYMLIPYYLFLVIETEEDIKPIITALLVGSGLLACIGLSQALGHDFWNTKIGLKFVFPSEMKGSSLNNVMGEKRAYMSHFNPNYVGSYVGLVFPILLVLLTFSRKIKVIIPYVLIAATLFIVLLASMAKSGLFGIAVALVFAIIFLRRQIIKHWYVVLSFIALVTLSIFIVGKINNTNYFVTTKNRMQGSVKTEKQEQKKLQDIITGERTLTIQYDNFTLVAAPAQDNRTLEFRDENNQPIASTYDETQNRTFISDERFAGISYSYSETEEGIPIHSIIIEGQTWMFTNGFIDQVFYYINHMGKACSIETQSNFLFSGYEHAFSNRIFLWEHTRTILKDYIILGSGADTFLLAYPQYDYVNMRNHSYGNNGQFISKPHNMYLQMAVQTGVISVIALLVFYLLYFAWCFRLYINHDFKDFTSQTGVAIFIGSISYMVIGMVNDSSITTAPTFWTLLGLGASINFMVQKQRNIKKEKTEE